jgi:hypothetical protein
MAYQDGFVNGAANGAGDDKRPAGRPSINGTSTPAPDQQPARDLLQLYHDAAAGSEGVMMLVTIKPDGVDKKGRTKTKAFAQKVRIGDVADMASRVVADGKRWNAYFAPAVIREDIEPGKRGKAEDIVAVLGFAADDDRDNGKPATMPPIEPTAIVQTCEVPTVNRHPHWVLSRPLTLVEAQPIADLMKRKVGGDGGTGDVAHVWRVPGTLNHPNAVKIARGRPKEPQQVRLVGGTMRPVDPDDLRRALESMPDIAPAAPRSKPKKASKPKASTSPLAGGDAAELIKNLPTKLRNAIRTEDTGDRSAGSFSVMCQLFERGLSPADVAKIALDSASLFASKFRDRGDLDQEIARVFANWTAGKLKREGDAADDLARMNEQYAVVKISGKTRVMALEEDQAGRGAMIPIYSSLRDFRDFEDKYRVPVQADGKIVPMGRGTWWIKHPDRRQYDTVVFDPDAAEDPRRFNLWRGFAVEPEEGDCSLYLANITDNICAGNDEHSDYLLNLMAWKVQNPGKRPEVAVVIKGGQGTGKGTMVNPYGALFGPHYVHITDPKHLTGNFNAHLQQACVTFADEAFFAGDRRHDGKLKGLITEPTIVIEPKGVDSYTVPNRLMIFMASNSDWVVPVDADARRYFVLSASDKRKQDFAYFNAIRQELARGGDKALLWWLQNRDLTGFNVRDIPKTAALADQKARSRRGVDLLVELLIEEGALPAQRADFPNMVVTSGADDGNGFWPRALKLVPDLKHQSNRVTANALKKEWGCTSWESNGLCGLRFPALQEMRTSFDAKHGPQEWDSKREVWGQVVTNDGSEPTEPT